MPAVLKKCLTKDGQAVIAAIDATEIIAESMSRLGAWPPAMYHLGQAMMASSLMQALPDRNDDEHLELQWKAPDGPFGSLFAECREKTQLRGSILNPRPQLSELQVPFGKGLLQVRRLKADRQLPISTGIVDSSGNVVADVLAYLEKSEQKTCALSLWIDIAWNDQKPENPFEVKHAYGFLVHVLPSDSLEQTHQILYQWDRHIASLGPISSWVINNDPTADILSFVSAEFAPQITFDKTLNFFCTCNEDRAARALAFMDVEDIKNPLGHYEPKKGDRHEVRCEFCGRVYLMGTQVAKDES